MDAKKNLAGGVIVLCSIAAIAGGVSPSRDRQVATPAAALSASTCDFTVTTWDVDWPKKTEFLVTVTGASGQTFDVYWSTTSSSSMNYVGTITADLSGVATDDFKVPDADAGNIWISVVDTSTKCTVPIHT